MLLNSVIIVLREVLEAGLLISVLLALSKTFNINFRWLIVAITFGFIGAVVYAMNLGVISELFEYTGQEVTNATLQIIIYISLVFLVIFIQALEKPTNLKNKKISLLMSIPIMLAIIREGSEIIIYFSGFIHNSEQVLSVIMGSFIGAGIGASIGVLIYYSILTRKSETLLMISKCALIVVATGLLSQSIPLLIQVDILEAYEPLWDTSSILSEKSMLGQLLYAVLGYESTPAPQQVAVYVAGIGIIFLGLILKGIKIKAVR